MELVCGLPQGSPISPIHFLLGMGHLHEGAHRYGYTDDGGALITGRNRQDLVARAQEKLNSIIKAARDGGVTLDPFKTEAILFSRKREESIDALYHGEHVVPIKREMKWLGVHLDSSLSFKTHIEERTKKAMTLARHIRGLSQVLRGVPPIFARQAIHTMVILKLLFGVELWYAGRSKPSHKKNRDGTFKQVRTGLLEQLDKMQKCITLAIIGCIPAWKTMPVTALQRESSTPPVHLLLDKARDRHGLRLRSLDKKHPLVRRIEGFKTRNRAAGPRRQQRPTLAVTTHESTPAFKRPPLQPPVYLPKEP